MAEGKNKNKKQVSNSNINSFESGLHSDFSPNRQPQGTYRFALNTVSETTEGDLGYRSNEPSNEAVAALPDGYKVLGHVYISDGEDIIFAVNEVNGTSLIGSLDKNSKFTSLVESDCLGFSVCNEIEATYRIKNGCDTIVYFVDHLNPDRAINISSLEDYIRVDFVEGTDDPLTKWNCSEFSIDRIDNTLSAKFIKYTENGSLPAGTLQLVLRHLDESKNGAGYTIATETIPIIDDSYSNDYFDIDGTIAMPTNKAAEFEIIGINTNYKYLEITAVVTTAGVTSSYVIDELIITDSLISYTVLHVDNVTPTELGEINKVKDIFSSKTITQLENRLIRGNIKCATKDYSTLQSYANDITSHYEVYQHDSEDASNLSVKTGDYYWYSKSYMRDEVYAFGIVYLYTDNTFSPVMHIPGRAKDSFGFTNQGTHRPTATTGWDTQQYSLVSSSWNQTTTIPDTEGAHLGLVAGDTVERWKVYNTAYKDSTLNPDIFSAGQMAYYESETNYPNTEDCNGNFIYGSLAGTPIRHHKFPDSSLEFNSTGSNKINALGIKFKDVALPPGTYAYRIVKCEREGNETVLDKGMSLYTKQGSDGTDTFNFQPYFFNLSGLFNISNLVNRGSIPDGAEAGITVTDGGAIGNHATIQSKLCFHSPLTKFKKPSLNGTYIKSENIFNSPSSDPVAEGPAATLSTSNYQLTGIIVDNTVHTSTINNKINKNSYVGDNSVLQAGILTNKFINNYSAETFAIELDSNTNMYDGADYLYTHAQGTITNNDGSVLLNSSLTGYHAIKTIKDVYNNLTLLSYYSVSKDWTTTDTTIIFGGDTFINKFHFVNSSRLETDVNSYVNRSHVSYDTGGGDKWHHNYATIMSFFTESIINSELRHELVGEVYYPKTFDPSYHLNCIPDGGGSYRPNYYNYNFDFNKANTVNLFLPLSNSYKYCSECECEFPNRVMYSEQSFQEELQDRYLEFKTNNYRDIMPNRGAITKVSNFNNQLLIDCEESRFYLPSTSQAIQASGEEVYIGTGEFFSVPVKEIMYSDTGYMGNQSQRASNITEHGIFSLDAKDGKVFLYRGQGNPDITGGYSNWFEENLPLKLESEYEDILGIEFPCRDNPANNVGFVSGYDTRYDRWLLTKHDFSLTEKGRTALDTNGPPRFETLTFEDGNWYLTKFITPSNSPKILINTKDYPDYFENCSWTMSYSVKDQSWTSFHSYIPNHYIGSKTKFYATIKDDVNIWRYNKKFEYQTFFGVQYPHIIELVSTKNPLETSIFNTIKFHTQAQQWDPVNKYFIDKRNITFDKANLYNSYQSSGDIALLAKREQNHLGRDQEVWHQQALLDINEKEYSFNEFRDLVENRDIPLFTKDWAVSNYRNNYYIDKVLNSTSINLNKNWWEQEVFRDKYLVIRLFFTTFVNTKLITNFNVTEKNYTES